MSAPQIIKTDGGEELVVLSRAEYERLIAEVGGTLDDADEDAFMNRVFDEGDAALKADGGRALSRSEWAAFRAREA